MQQMDDLRSSFVPPELNILKARIVMYKLQNAPDRETAQKQAQQFQQEREKYEAAQRRVPQLKDEKLRTLITVDANRATTEYFDFAQKTVIPAFLEGNKKKGDELIPVLRAKYESSEALTAQIIDAIQREDDALMKSAAEEVRWRTIMQWVLSAVIVVVMMSLGMIVTGSVTKNVSGMLNLIQEIANSNLSVADMEITSGDEVGQAGLALNQMKRNLSEIICAIAGLAEQVASASEQLSATSQHIAATADQTSAQANVVTTAGEQVSSNVSVVATGSEEMLASIREISKNSSEAARITKEAVAATENANHTIAKLGDSSAEIGKVTKVITAIAEQTNLLALNATIEAARAGDAGKGFAVVANEVKELAKETAKATEDISRRIEAIQTDTKGAVHAIGEISAVINHVNDISSTIASSVEEQTATTNEMARNITEAAKGSSEIAQNIAGVAEGAKGTSSGANETKAAAAELARLSTQMQKLLQKFRVGAQSKAIERGQQKAYGAHA
jgi:methyl-accepting chemotaxis protein